MPLPCPEVFEDIFNLYQRIREKDHNSILGQFVYGVEKLVSFLNNNKNDPTIVEIEKIRQEISTTLKLIKVKDHNTKFGMWIDLLFTLGEKAKKAQELKYKADESLFCETLHMLRNYIITCLCSDEIYEKKFKDYVHTLQQQTNQFYASLVNEVKENNGRDAEELLKSYYKNILNLAFLEDKNAIIVARKANLLAYLNVYPIEKLVSEYNVKAEVANAFIPFCLQTNFLEALYGRIFQKTATIAFEDFAKNAANKKPSNLEHTSSMTSINNNQPSLSVTNSAEIHSSYHAISPLLASPDIKPQGIQQSLNPDRILCPQFFSDYFQLYEVARLPDRESKAGIAKHTVEYLGSTVTGKETTIGEISKIKTFILTEVKEIEDTESEKERFSLWFKLIFTLGKKAEEAQGLKYKTDESLFCKTLHALRSYLVSALAHDPHYKESFKQAIQALQQEAQLWDQKLHKDVHEFSGINAEMYLGNYQECVLKLALLENKEAIIAARLNNLFTYLKCYSRKDLTTMLKVEPQIANPFIPYCLHPEFFRCLYEAEYQRNKNISFDNFEADAIKEYEEMQGLVPETDENNASPIPPKVEVQPTVYAAQDPMPPLEAFNQENTTLAQVKEETSKLNLNKYSMFNAVPVTTDVATAIKEEYPNPMLNI